MAVYTEVSDDDLAAFVASYNLGALLSYKGIAEGVENTNYLVHTEKGPFFLTLYEKRVAPDDLPFAVGEALARLHLAGTGFRIERPNALGLTGWRPLYQRFQSRADEIAPQLAATIEHELDDLEARWPGGLEHGVIHADLFPDNVFFLGDKLSALIDFYFACNDALAYDVAVTLNAWCFEADHAFNITKGRALLKGYESVRQLAPAERDALPLLARGAALRFLLTRAYDWLHTPKDALVRPHDPIEYLRRLKFHRGIRAPREYGLTDGS
jgi:homoserine kinase type II